MVDQAAPQRIQRRRTAGWRMGAGDRAAIYVGRPTRWGNKYRAAAWPGPRGKKIAVGMFRLDAVDRLVREPSWLEPLRGHDLACWCALEEPCHADVLLELANA